jgi:hypothetical protein
LFQILNQAPGKTVKSLVFSSNFTRGRSGAAGCGTACKTAFFDDGSFKTSVLKEPLITIPERPRRGKRGGQQFSV